MNISTRDHSRPIDDTSATQIDEMGKTLSIRSAVMGILLHNIRDCAILSLGEFAILILIATFHRASRNDVFYL